MNQQLSAQDYEHRIWLVLRLFYKSLIDFRRQYDSYEEKVLKLAQACGLDRKSLRLRPVELADLLHFKSLEDLRDGYIHELKDLCHTIFRSNDQTDPLDRYVSDIFHEISILKEEHYTVKTYAPLYEKAAQEVELQYILDEAHAMFPQKLGQVLYLFGKAQERMEQNLLPSFGANQIVIRSLYHLRDRFVKEAYPDGLRDFYRYMYPCGPLEGFYLVGLSFYHSGFFPEALTAFQRAEEEYEGVLRAAVSASQESRGSNGDPVRRSKLEVVRSIARSLRAKLRRLTGETPRYSSASAPSFQSLQGTTALGPIQD